MPFWEHFFCSREWQELLGCGWIEMAVWRLVYSCGVPVNVDVVKTWTSRDVGLLNVKYWGEMSRLVRCDFET